MKKCTFFDPEKRQKREFSFWTFGFLETPKSAEKGRKGPKRAEKAEKGQKGLKRVEKGPLYCGINFSDPLTMVRLLAKTALFDPFWTPKSAQKVTFSGGGVEFPPI